MKVVVNGANGRMGQEVLKLIKNKDNTKLVGTCDKVGVGNPPKSLKNSNLIVKDNLKEILNKKEVDLVIDFTTPNSVMDNIRIVLNNNINMIVGTTGITESDLKEIKKIVGKNKIIIAPNFAIGAVLMMELSKKAAKYLDDVEIIESHHNKKIDSPSGTAIKTAEGIAKNLNNNRKEKDYIESIKGVRGGKKDNISIHSIRLKGLVAHQKVIFGAKGQSLTIRHDSFNRESFMPGVEMAIDNLKNIDGLVYGLEKLL
ncbi:MAG: 4-hydroxy-tetrahydrodipicolinate reductase [Bacillota bacterium]